MGATRELRDAYLDGQDEAECCLLDEEVKPVNPYPEAQRALRKAWQDGFDVYMAEHGPDADPRDFK